jgi:hypothetical protein
VSESARREEEDEEAGKIKRGQTRSLIRLINFSTNCPQALFLTTKLLFNASIPLSWLLPTTK